MRAARPTRESITTAIAMAFGTKGMDAKTVITEDACGGTIVDIGTHDVITGLPTSGWRIVISGDSVLIRQTSGVGMLDVIGAIIGSITGQDA